MHRILVLPSLLALSLAPAMAETTRPESLRALLDYHAAACAGQGGSLTIADDAIAETDLNGDGQTDMLLDSGKLACSTSPAMFCVDGSGCELNVFVGSEQHTIIVQSWRLVDAGDRQDLIATIAGHLLQRPKDLTARMAWDDANKGLKLVEELND